MELQTPEQLQFVSNLAHWIEGTIFALVAIIAFLRVRGWATWKGSQYLWPALIVTAGLFLPVYIILQIALNQGGATWDFVVNDPQQLEHGAMALLLILAGTAELLIEARILQGAVWKFAAPVALVSIGLLLFFHTEYGTPEAIAEAVTQHRYQGSLVIGVGVLKAAEVHWRRSVKVARLSMDNPVVHYGNYVDQLSRTSRSICDSSPIVSSSSMSEQGHNFDQLLSCQLYASPNLRR